MLISKYFEEDFFLRHSKLLITEFTKKRIISILFLQGAMVYVVVDDIVPEAQSQGNGRAASWGAVVR